MMKHFWGMRTTPERWNAFLKNSLVGIHEDAIAASFSSFSGLSEDEFSTKSKAFTEYRHRVFRDFCRRMRHNDILFVGTGDNAEYNLCGIVRVYGDYKFSTNAPFEHTRKVEILKSFNPPRELLKLVGCRCLELYHRDELVESLIALI